jgi:hypothetical protein
MKKTDKDYYQLQKIIINDHKNVRSYNPALTLIWKNKKDELFNSDMWDEETFSDHLYEIKLCEDKFKETYLEDQHFSAENYLTEKEKKGIGELTGLLMEETWLANLITKQNKDIK